MGLISVTFINLTALFGAIILPFRNKPTFKWILSTFIGLGKKYYLKIELKLFKNLIIGVGTLLGTGIFHLIPMVKLLLHNYYLIK